jgi:hypothetical protein
VTYWYGSSSIPVMNHLNMVRLAWYLTPIGIWLGVAGVVGVVLIEPLHRAWPVLCVGLSFTVLYLYNILNNPFHVYAMRRYVPVVVPFLVMAMAYALVGIWRLRTRWRITGWLAVIGTACLVVWLGYRGLPVWTLVEYKGLQSQLRQVVTRLEPGAVLLFDDEPTVGIGSTIGTPLQYQYGFTSYDLQEAELSIPGLERAVVDWTAEGRPVYWVVGMRPVLGPPESLSPDPVFGTWLDTVQLEQSYHELPRDRLPYQVALEFYRLHPESEGHACSPPISIDVGTLDTTYVVSGYYDKERLGQRTVRWTDGDGLIKLPCVPANLGDSLRLAITVAASRPDGAEQPSVTVWVGETAWEPIAVSDGFEIAEYVVPTGELAAHGIRLVSDTWVPSEHGVSADGRRLGVLVDSITVTAGLRDD